MKQEKRKRAGIALKKAKTQINGFMKRRPREIFLFVTLLKLGFDILVIINRSKVSLLFSIMYAIVGVVWIVSMWNMLSEGSSK